MKERRGTVGRLTGLAGGVAAAARRRQRDRAPRVLVYDAGGHPATLEPEDARFAGIVAAAERMIELAGDRAAQSSRGGVGVPEPRGDGELE